MAVLPAQPHLDHLRREARELLRAAQAGDGAAADRIRALSDRLTLASAQLAVARGYGFASWPKLKDEVLARAADLARVADEFCHASVRDWTGRAATMLAARPELAAYNFATAVVLGDAERVRGALAADPGLATRTDPRTGWTALHLACASRWNRASPARADGLTAVAALLLDAGADPAGRPDPGSQWTPLLCSVAGAPNPPITQLLLDRGAVPADHDLYLAGFAADHECLRILLGHADVRAIAKMALAAPISGNDAEGVRLLLEAGADPREYRNDDDQPYPVIYAVVEANGAAEIAALLLAYGASPDAPGPDGRSPLAFATSKGRADLTGLLREHGAADDATQADRFLAACLRADRDEAERQLARQPGLVGQLTDAQQADAMIRAAETGHAEPIKIMLELGFRSGARGGEQGATALHAAGFAGSAEIARLLIEHGADLEARDREWHDTPLGWAAVGSGFAPPDNPGADWLATIRVLVEAGASLAGITLSPDDAKPPSREAADLLRRYLAAGQH